MTTVNRDDEHLRILSICHYVYGGLQALFACIPLMWVFFGLMFVLMAATEGGEERAEPAIFGVLIMAFGLCAVLIGWAFAACTLYAGRCLAQRKHYTFCFVIAVISCLSIPWGTILGVFTLIVLSRPSAKALFETGRRE